jgi:hypothetical protein
MAADVGSVGVVVPAAARDEVAAALGAAGLVGGAGASLGAASSAAASGGVSPVAAGGLSAGVSPVAAGGLSAGVNLLSLADVKGLEFDAAVVVEPAAILAERPDGGRGGLYTALTRSTRALAVAHAEPLPAELAAADDLHVIRDPAGWAAHRRG